MLNITSLSEFRSKVAHKEEIREADLGAGCTSFCYMVAGEDTFSDEWARECRGIVFNTAGGFVAARPLHKFFNVNERESTRVERLDWSKVERVMAKLDGSMIHTVWTEAGVRLKSKKSFDSAVAKAAEDWMHGQADLRVWRFVNGVVARGKTATFEWTAPDARIVLFYPEPELQLLHVRDNVTGEYATLRELQGWAAGYGVKVVSEVNEFWQPGAHLEAFGADEWKVDVDALLKAAKTREGVEGWVIQFEGGEMVKLKTEWYLKRHRAMTFLRERDVAQLVLDEGLDDLKSLLVGDGVDITQVLEVEARVLHDLRELALAVDLAVSEDQRLDRKSFALKHAGTEYFGLKMTKYLGKEPNFKEYFERNLLRERYSLRQLVLLESKAEGE